MQEAIDSEEFAVWLVADAYGLLPDRIDVAGTVAAAVANFGLSPPKVPVSASDFRPKRKKKANQKDKAITLGEKLTAQPRQANVSSNGLTWKL